MFFGQPFGGLIPGARGAVLSALMRTGAPLTGREVHNLVDGKHSLWSVQEALKVLAGLGIVETRTIGRAGVHTINDDHVVVPHLRALVSPVELLRNVIKESVGSRVESVLVFGSTARGEATESSDLDLAVIASTDWDGRADLEDSVRARLGNECDIVVFTASEFAALARSGEPIVSDILRDGYPLVGAKPQIKVGAP